MPLLEVIHIKKLSATVFIDEPHAKTLDQYAAYIHASADEVINKALEYIFAKDKDFQKHIAENPGAIVPASLRLKQPPASKKTHKAAKKPTPIAAQR
jgi:hypothetical protein